MCFAVYNPSSAPRHLANIVDGGDTPLTAAELPDRAAKRSDASASRDCYRDAAIAGRAGFSVNPDFLGATSSVIGRGDPEVTADTQSALRRLRRWRRLVSLVSR